MRRQTWKQAELGGGGGFSSAVDADDEDDEGLAIGPRGGREEIVGEAAGELAAGDFHDVVAGDLAAECAEFVDDGGGEADAEIGGDEIGLEFVPIDFGAVGDLVEEGFEKASHAAGRLQRQESRDKTQEKMWRAASSALFPDSGVWTLPRAQDPCAPRHSRQPGGGG